MSNESPYPSRTRSLNTSPTSFVIGASIPDRDSNFILRQPQAVSVSLSNLPAERVSPWSPTEFDSFSNNSSVQLTMGRLNFGDVRSSHGESQSPLWDHIMADLESNELSNDRNADPVANNGPLPASSSQSSVDSNLNREINRNISAVTSETPKNLVLKLKNSEPSQLVLPSQTRLKIRIKKWNVAASWRWMAGDETCGICRMPFEACCIECKTPGDECPLALGTCKHAFHMHCIVKWTETQNTPRPQCPLCRQEWKFAPG